MRGNRRVCREANSTCDLSINRQPHHILKALHEPVRCRLKVSKLKAKALGLPEEIWDRPPFPGPALATRVIGEVTPERVATVRAATVIVEEELLFFFLERARSKDALVEQNLRHQGIGPDLKPRVDHQNLTW